MNRVSSTLDIGALKRLRILCISETGWFDTATVFDDIRAAGGAQSDQYAIPWPPFGRLHTENASDFSALLEAETTDGRPRRLLFDTRWSPEWMDGPHRGREDARQRFAGPAGDRTAWFSDRLVPG